MPPPPPGDNGIPTDVSDAGTLTNPDAFQDMQSTDPGVATDATSSTDATSADPSASLAQLLAQLQASSGADAAGGPPAMKPAGSTEGASPQPDVKSNSGAPDPFASPNDLIDNLQAADSQPATAPAQATTSISDTTSGSNLQSSDPSISLAMRQVYVGPAGPTSFSASSV